MRGDIACNVRFLTGQFMRWAMPHLVYDSGNGGTRLPVLGRVAALRLQ